MVLFAVNDGLEPISRPLDFSAFGSKGQDLEVWTLADRKQAGEPDVTNSFGEPERISSPQTGDQRRLTALHLPVPATVIKRDQVAGSEWKMSETPQYVATGSPPATAVHGVQARTTCSIVMSAFLGVSSMASSAKASGRSMASGLLDLFLELEFQVREILQGPSRSAWADQDCHFLHGPAGGLGGRGGLAHVCLAHRLLAEERPKTELPNETAASHFALLAWACSRSSFSRALRTFS